jgi:hypothetical protein
MPHVWASLCLVAALVSLPQSARAQTVVLNPLPAADQAAFWHTPEGGAVMPLAWYDALEVVDADTGEPTGQVFAERMPFYGFLDDPAHELPVGFGTVSLDFLFGLPGLSVNCAACHVGELHYGSQRLRVLGGPNVADLRGFSQDVYRSILAAVTQPREFLGFLQRSQRLAPTTQQWLNQRSPATTDAVSALLADVRLVPLSHSERRHTLQAPNDAAYRRVETALLARDVPRLRRAKNAAEVQREATTSAALLDVYRNLQQLIAEAQYFLAQGQFPLSTREGYGRLDAFATVRFLLFPEESADFPFTAPVSVPHLWGTGEKQWLHWNANTNSTLQRNIAQALGMGALEARGGISNVLVPNLATLETLSQQIVAPAWPAEVFGALDGERVARGQALYQQRCGTCHDAGVADASTGLIVHRLSPLSEVQTDPNDAWNFHQPVGGQSFPVALQARLDSMEQWYYRRRTPLQPVPVETQIEWAGGPSRMPPVWRDPLATDVDAPVYAALPLRGVWATPPYLHNNSVPTLRELLKPSSQRPTVFMVGQRDYDPVSVGYVQPADLSSIPLRHRCDTRDAGNANTGHEGPAFGAEGLSAGDVDDLLEYLKSL